MNAKALIASTFFILMHPRSVEAGSGTDTGGGVVAVKGAVKSGNEIQWREGMRLFHAIRAAGGLTESADVRHITITRWTVVTTHDLRIAGSSPDNPVLKAGDQIFVPRREAPIAKPQKKSKRGTRP